LRVLHVSLWDNRGGAAIAANRLHCELLEQNLDSHMLVERSTGTTPKTHLIAKGWQYHLARLEQKFSGRRGEAQKDHSLFGCSLNDRKNGLLKCIDALDPDIVHLHWVGGGVLRIEELPKIKRPLVWTLHDMWPVCGSEHYSFDDHERWAHDYAPELRPKDATGPDLTRRTWLRKQRAWKNASVTTVSPSRWMRDCAARSSLWKERSDCRHLCIPNGLDTSIFTPGDKLGARNALGLAADATILLFGAFSMKGTVKGGDLLVKALDVFRQFGHSAQLVTFGGGDLPDTPGYEVRHFGRFEDPEALVQLYRAADVMLVPSRLETFGQTASEAQACGTPVVCFDCSGLKDVVLDRETGYRAKPYEIHDFAYGIGWALGNTEVKGLSARARDHVVTSFDKARTVRQHMELYSELL